MTADDGGTAMEHANTLLGHVVKTRKNDVEKAERVAEEIVEEAFGPPRATAKP